MAVFNMMLLVMLVGAIATLQPIVRAMTKFGKKETLAAVCSVQVVFFLCVSLLLIADGRVVIARCPSCDCLMAEL